MGLCARTVATTDAANSTAASSCNCHRQTSITAGTIDSTKLPLTVWFQAIYLMTQDKKGVSAMKRSPSAGRRALRRDTRCA